MPVSSSANLQEDEEDLIVGKVRYSCISYSDLIGERQVSAQSGHSLERCDQAKPNYIAI
jgi:hypothetical protein